MVNSSTLVLKSNVYMTPTIKDAIYVRILVKKNNKNHLKYQQNVKK